MRNSSVVVLLLGTLVVAVVILQLYLSNIWHSAYSAIYNQTNTIPFACTTASPSSSSSSSSLLFHTHDIPSISSYKNEEIYKHIMSLQSQKIINLTATRLIYSMNAGHTGSGYLFTLLKAAGAFAYHEDNPSFLVNWLNNTCKRGWDATFSERRAYKLPVLNEQIAKLDNGWRPTVDNHTGKPVYADTNHMFFKCMHDFIMQEYVQKYQITVVLLRRYLPETARSNMANFIAPYGAPEFWVYSSDTCKFSLTYPDPPPQNTTELIYSYVVDLELHMRKFVHTWGMHPNVKIVEVRLEDLQKPEHTLDFLREVGLSVENDINATTSVNKVLGQVFNSKNASKIFGEISGFETGLREFILNRFDGQNLSLSMFPFDQISPNKPSPP